MAAESKLLVIGGPTASGKTKLAIKAATHFGTEIISADSRQFYEEMRIGNARPSPEELSAAPHHFIADRSLTQALSAGRFAGEAMQLLSSLFQRHEVVVTVGGSGLYLRALCEGLDDFPEVPEAAARRVQTLAREEGIRGLQRELKRLDPDYHARVDLQNPRRIERALRVCYASGRAYSSFLGQQSARPFAVEYFALKPPRDELYARIDRRVDKMVAAGLRGEAYGLRTYAHLPVMRTVGYQEWTGVWNEEYDEPWAVELIKRNSRRYAKRQLSWFRDYREVKDVADLVASFSRTS